MSYFNKFLLGGFVQTGQNCTTASDIFGDGSDLALYRFQGNGVDDSGNSNNGTFTNTFPSLTNGAQPLSGARFGGGYAGSATADMDSGITIPAITAYSISLWFKISTTGIRHFFFTDSNNVGASATNRVNASITTGDNLSVAIGNGSTFWNDSTTDFSPYLDGNWHHFVWTISGTALNIYVDNTSIASFTTTVSAGTAGTNSIIIGNARFNDVGIQGFLDQVRIFTRNLTPTNVTTVFEDYKCQPGSTDSFSQCTTDTVGYPVNAAGVAGNGDTVAFYKLDDAAGSATAADSTSNAFNGTATAVTFGNQGIYGSCAEFNGSTSEIDLPALGLSGTQARTISMWVKTNATPTAVETLYSSGITGAGGNLFAFYVGTNNEILLSYQDRNWLTPNNVIPNNGWHHVTVTYNGGARETNASQVIYIDGVAQTITSVGTGTGVSTNPDSNYSLGYVRSNNTSYFNGFIDQVRIYDTVLTAAQVKQLYEEVYCDTGCTTSTVDYQTTAGALYRLDGNGNDSSTNEYTGTVGTSVTFVQGKYDLASNHTGAAGAANIIDTGYSPDPSSAITYSWWAKFNATGQNNFTIVDQTSPSGVFPGFGLYFVAGNVQIVIDGSASPNNTPFTEDLLWHHYVLRHDGAGNCTFYFDGSLFFTDSRTQIPTNTTQNIVIGGNNGVWGNWNGQVDQLRVYPSFLTPAQITNLYNEVSCS